LTETQVTTLSQYCLLVNTTPRRTYINYHGTAIIFHLPHLLADNGKFGNPWSGCGFTYKSRPDLAPPKLNITIPASSSVEKGFLFIAPFTGFPNPVDHGPLQPAPYILTDTGDLVWSGFTYFSVWAANFQVAKWKGREVLFAFEDQHNSLHGHGHGHHTFLDQHYRNIRELRAGNYLLSDKHDFIIINEETALIQIYHPIELDLHKFGAQEGQTWIVDARF
jgi:hypothetical protein